MRQGDAADLSIPGHFSLYPNSLSIYPPLTDKRQMRREVAQRAQAAANDTGSASIPAAPKRAGEIRVRVRPSRTRLSDEGQIHPSVSHCKEKKSKQPKPLFFNDSTHPVRRVPPRSDRPLLVSSRCLLCHICPTSWTPVSRDCFPAAPGRLGV
jgi:hypothetical protein